MTKIRKKSTEKKKKVTAIEERMSMKIERLSRVLSKKKEENLVMNVYVPKTIQDVALLLSYAKEHGLLNEEALCKLVLDIFNGFKDFEPQEWINVALGKVTETTTFSVAEALKEDPEPLESFGKTYKYSSENGKEELNSNNEELFLVPDEIL